MQGTLFHEVIELHFLKTTRGADALLVSCRHVAGRRCSGSLGFRAFEDDDVAGHKMGGDDRLLATVVKRI